MAGIEVHPIDAERGVNGIAWKRRIDAGVERDLAAEARDRVLESPNSTSSLRPPAPRRSQRAGAISRRAQRDALVADLVVRILAADDPVFAGDALDRPGS